VVAAGIAVHEALAAFEELQKEDIAIRVVDLYSMKRLDERTLKDCDRATRFFVTVEDHHPGGGLGEVVRSAGSNPLPGGRAKAQERQPFGTVRLRGYFPNRHRSETQNPAGSLRL